MIDISKLRTLLKFDGVDTSDYTTEELKVLVDSKCSELKGIVGFDVTPTHRIQHEYKFKGKMLRLNFYPIVMLAEIKKDGCVLCNKKYYVDKDLGIVHFNEMIIGNLEIKYISGISEELFINFVEPLLKDMIAYTLTNNTTGNINGPISSIKEGDVSVNYDTSNNLGNKISSRLDELKTQYGSVRLRLL